MLFIFIYFREDNTFAAVQNPLRIHFKTGTGVVKKYFCESFKVCVAQRMRDIDFTPLFR